MCLKQTVRNEHAVDNASSPSPGVSVFGQTASAGAYEGEHDLRSAQRLLGHASIETTQRYIAVGAADMRAAMMHARVSA